MATLRLPATGYGIRYEYGMFNQAIEHGAQVERPENWLRYGNPWEFPRPEILYPVRFGGRVERRTRADGWLEHAWVDTGQVMAMAYDVPVPGYKTNTVNNLRLWAAKSTREFELQYFNEGDYIRAVEAKNESENISRVLYPDDTTEMGRALRLKQEHFFVSASLQDILRSFLDAHEDLTELPDKVAVQLNDTHPALAIPELMRLLIDRHRVPWERAWAITRRVFGYTNHTLMPEALETWPVVLLGELLPRHLEIIYEINRRFLDEVAARRPGDDAARWRLSLIDETGERRVRMGHLAALGAHKVNGVSALHTRLMQTTSFADFHGLFPTRIVNVTNGVSPRRWLALANPRLARLITDQVGAGWAADLERLAALGESAGDAAFQDAFLAVKRANKARLAGLISQRLGVSVDPDALFDVHIKRIHEYKRQLLNLLHVITVYNRLREGHTGTPPRMVIFSGKAAPGYDLAKLLIRLIHDVARTINADTAVADRLRMVFIPNYDVTTASDVIPAAELSEQISLAGTEASGTGNMKLALNGALTIGTLDGANLELRETVGAENFFAFGLSAEEAGRRRARHDPARRYDDAGPELKQTLDQIRDGRFSPEEPERYAPLVDSLTDGGDPYLVLAEFPAYAETQQRVTEAYADPRAWTAMAIRNVAGMGRFSSDRTVRDYARRIWRVEPVAHE